MENQKEFFLTSKDEELIIKLIKENNDLLINEMGGKILEFGKPVVYSSSKPLDSKIIKKAFIYTSKSRIIKDKNGFVNELFSDVIEFSRCEVKNEKHLWNGRIWVETKYYYDNQEIEKKPDWLNIKYNYYQRWIKKNLMPNKDNNFYIGKDAYKLYKEEGYKMKNSPLVELDFD